MTWEMKRELVETLVVEIREDTMETNGSGKAIVLVRATERHRTLLSAGERSVTMKVVIPNLPVLATDRVRHHGDGVAVIAAQDIGTARAALAAIVVEYETLPAVFDPERALDADAPLTHEPPALAAAVVLIHVVRDQWRLTFECSSRWAIDDAWVLVIHDELVVTAVAAVAA